MTRTFVELPVFRSRWKDLGLTDADLIRLQTELLADTKVGDVMRGTGGVRKMRFAFRHKGKSGSIRVRYISILKFTKRFICLRHILKMKKTI